MVVLSKIYIIFTHNIYYRQFVLLVFVLLVFVPCVCPTCVCPTCNCPSCVCTTFVCPTCAWFVLKKEFYQILSAPLYSVICNYNEQNEHVWYRHVTRGVISTFSWGPKKLLFFNATGLLKNWKKTTLYM